MPEPQNLINISIAQTLSIRIDQVTRTIDLLDEGNTIPFIARYRKEMTGGLDEVQLRDIQQQVEYQRKLKARKEAIINSITEQGKLTDELNGKILRAATLQEAEDLYLPYKPKRRTKATIARERGLEPLANHILANDIDGSHWTEVVKSYLNDDVPTVEDALEGARNIVAEIISEDSEIRTELRRALQETGLLACKAGDQSKDDRKVYQMYYDYQEKFQNIPPHRLLAVNRGENDGVLKVKLEMDAEEALKKIERKYPVTPAGLATAQVAEAIEDSHKRLIAPAIERELRNTATEAAEAMAIKTFSKNLKNLLLQPPLKGKVILGIDPGFRTGCKAVIVDATGKYLEGRTIYPHEPQKQWAEAKAALSGMIVTHKAELMAVGNGTASRETEKLAAEIIEELGKHKPPFRCAYVMVSEAGASVYSASDLARKEFPNLDVSMRGAISIARRLQDPLAELVKIDPKAIGVGLYQHDVDQKQLSQALDAVVEDAVNQVGVDANTASVSLLAYVSGINQRLAEEIVRSRDEKGPFADRGSIRKVKGFGEKTYEQAIGFMKIPGGLNPLDNTFIHPESYAVVEKLLQRYNIQNLDKASVAKLAQIRKEDSTLNKLAKELAVGLPTLQDILDNLIKPGRDPRDDLPKPLLRQDVLAIEDLKEGMLLNGTVRNVVDFGAFVDIGVKQDGLVHISEMADKFVQNPHSVLSVGDVITVRIKSVDLERKRIALSLRSINN